MQNNNNYINLNASLLDGINQEKEALKDYFLNNINKRTQFFHSLKEKLHYLINENYYKPDIFQMYGFIYDEKENNIQFVDNENYELLKNLYQYLYDYKFRFKALINAVKFYNSYALKSNDGKNILERYEDRLAILSLYYGQGDFNKAFEYAELLIKGVFQPATPTFLNVGKKRAGEYISCFELQVDEDSLNGIARTINNAMQLSKIGGGVGIALSNLRAKGDPIKDIEGIGSGIVPMMKVLEDSLSWINQLGQRNGACVVTLHACHLDILDFLDTKRENADEKIRIKSLSLSIAIPDALFKAAKNNEYFYMFSSYDVQKKYNKKWTELDIDSVYDELVADENIRKNRINARVLWQKISMIQMQSGYPFLFFDKNVNNAHMYKERIFQSNLCCEILQSQEASSFEDNLDYRYIGKDVSCNLGALNLVNLVENNNFEKDIELAIEALTIVSEDSNINQVPSIAKGNEESRSIGLGAMNLHGLLAKNHIHYDSQEAIEIAKKLFKAIRFYSLKASNKLAKKTGISIDLSNSKYMNSLY